VKRLQLLSTAKTRGMCEVLQQLQAEKQLATKICKQQGCEFSVCFKSEASNHTTMQDCAYCTIN